MRICVAIAVVVTSLFQQPARAQDGQAPAGPRIYHLSESEVAALRGELPSFPEPAIPPGRDGWVIEIVTSGGFTGRTFRNTIDSRGSMTCPASCAAAPIGALSIVASSVKAAVDASWPVAPAANGVSVANVSVCNDCVTTRLSLWYRDAAGSVRFFRAQWNMLSADSVDPLVRQLHERVLGAVRP